jgi:hypothetical protein
MASTYNESVELYLFGTRLQVYPDGKIERLMKSGNWKVVENGVNHRHGYNVIMINTVQYTRARIVAYAFLNTTTLTNKSIVIHHKDKDRLNCSVDNLSVETYSSINYYRNDTQGYYKNSTSSNYVAMITHNGVTKRLGTFSTEQEAHNAYLNARAELLIA